MLEYTTKKEFVSLGKKKKKLNQLPFFMGPKCQERKWARKKYDLGFQCERERKRSKEKRKEIFVTSKG